MEALEVLQNQVKRIAAERAGQTPNVRTVMGRQLLFYHRNSPMFLFPTIPSGDLIVSDTSSMHFGEIWFVMDLDGLDEALLF